MRFAQKEDSLGLAPRVTVSWGIAKKFSPVDQSALACLDMELMVLKQWHV